MRIAVLFFTLLALPLSAQVSSTPATIMAGYGSPIANGILCSVGTANSNSTSLYDDRSILVGNSVWKCKLLADGITYAWIAPFSAPSVSGSSISQINLGSGLTATTICDTSTTCPAGFYHLDIFINVTTAGTLGSITAVTLAYTDDIGAASINLASASSASCPSLSLITASRCSLGVNFYKAANSSVTLSTTVGTLTGSPKYNLRAVLLQNQ